MNLIISDHDIFELKEEFSYHTYHNNKTKYWKW